MIHQKKSHSTIQKPWKINQQMTPSSTNIFPLKAVITADTQGSRNLATPTPASILGKGSR